MARQKMTKLKSIHGRKWTTTNSKGIEIWKETQHRLLSILALNMDTTGINISYPIEELGVFKPKHHVKLLTLT